MDKIKENVVISKEILLIVALAVVLLAGSVSSYQWTCFSKAQFIDFCGNIPDRTCAFTQCMYCMNYNVSGQCYTSSSFGKCNDSPPLCGPGNGTIDEEDPVLDITTPFDNGIFPKRSVNIDVTSSEEIDLYYIDADSGSVRWIRICDNCLSYNRSKSFKEGLNNIRFKAIDNADNEVQYNVSFITDSKKPRITKTLPKARDFGSGILDIRFKELNPKTLILTHGNDALGYNTQIVDINGSCQNNIIRNDEYYCTTEISQDMLDIYDGKEILYWFNLTDIANNQEVSKPINVKIDVTPPVINDINVIITGRRATIIANISELNFDEANYIDNSVSNPRERIFCSSMRNGICKRSLSLSVGTHNIDFIFLDDAGNAASTNLVISI